MEAQVQERLLQMWEETLAQVPEIMKASVSPALFERFADNNRASARAYVAAIRRENDAEFPHRRDEQWANMFDVRILPTQARLTEPEANVKIAARIAAEYLRQHVTCPPMLDNAEASWTDARGYRWPSITCDCKGCVFRSEGTDIFGVVDKDGDSEYRDHLEHPWDQELRCTS